MNSVIGLLGLSVILSLSVFGISQSFAQLDSCVSCVQILPHEIELYQDLFPLTIWADTYVYDHNSVITINGHLRTQNTVSPILIVVTNPIGNVVTIEQITPKNNGDFTFTLNSKSTLLKQDGDYVVKAQSGVDTRQFKTKFTLVSYTINKISECAENEISLLGGNGKLYCLPFTSEKGTLKADATLDVPSKTLSLKIRGQSSDSLILDIPRNVLDSKSSSGSDSDFVVMSGGKIIEFKQISSDADSRQVKIDYDPSKSRTFQIIGTYVVPEFGSIVMFVLIGSIGTILLFSRTFSNRIVKF